MPQASGRQLGGWVKVQSARQRTLLYYKFIDLEREDNPDQSPPAS
jgi:hypothetical protein